MFITLSLVTLAGYYGTPLVTRIYNQGTRLLPMFWNNPAAADTLPEASAESAPAVLVTEVHNETEAEKPKHLESSEVLCNATPSGNAGATLEKQDPQSCPSTSSELLNAVASNGHEAILASAVQDEDAEVKSRRSYSPLASITGLLVSADAQHLNNTPIDFPSASHKTSLSPRAPHRSPVNNTFDDPTTTVVKYHLDASRPDSNSPRSPKHSISESEGSASDSASNTPISSPRSFEGEEQEHVQRADDTRVTDRNRISACNEISLPSAVYSRIPPPASNPLALASTDVVTNNNIPVQTADLGSNKTESAHPLHVKASPLSQNPTVPASTSDTQEQEFSYPPVHNVNTTEPANRVCSQDTETNSDISNRSPSKSTVTDQAADTLLHPNGTGS